MWLLSHGFAITNCIPGPDAPIVFAHRGDGGLVQKMLSQDLDLLFGTELSALGCFVSFVVVAHALFRVRKSILAQTRKKDISTEAEHYQLVARRK